MNRLDCLTFIIVSAALLSCSEKGSQDDFYDPKISFSAGMGGTKALLNDINITDGTQVCLYDILGSNAEYTPHIDGKTAVMSDGEWSIAGAPDGGYPWKHDDRLYDHAFFCWLTQDASGMKGDNLFRDESDNKITPQVSNDGNGVYTWSVGAVPMRFTYDQFDFCYSNIIRRQVENPDYSTVHLNLQHLFAAIAIRFHNYDSAPVTLKQVKIYGLTNVKSASIEFDTNSGDVDVTYNGNYVQSRQTAANALKLMDQPIVIPPDGEVMNIINNAYVGGGGTEQERFFLMWPQTEEELPNCRIVVEIEGIDVPYDLSLKPVGAPSTYSWDAGTKHHIELSTKGKKIDLNVQSLPWDKDDIVLNDQLGVECNGTESMVHFESCTEDEENKILYFKGGQPIKMSFKLDNPLNATWMIKMEGDIDAFEIDNAGPSGTDVNYGDKVSTPTGTIDGQFSYVTVYPINLDPEIDYECQLSIVVRTSTGRLIVADPDKVLGKYKDYKIVQQAS